MLFERGFGNSEFYYLIEDMKKTCNKERHTMLLTVI